MADESKLRADIKSAIVGLIENTSHRATKISFGANSTAGTYKLTIEVQSVVPEHIAVYDNARQTIANEVSQFLQDAGFEDASKAVDCEFEL